MLEAVAATAPGHDLVLEVREVERDRRTRERVEVLEGDAGGVGAVHLSQPGIGPAGQSDAVQVGLDDGERRHRVRG